ncbi:MAG: histidine kinase [Actinomycetota bacterium]|nr:histidine kinase [Actinomycetota bacterium]
MLPEGVLTRSAPWLAWSIACVAVILSLAAAGVGPDSALVQWKSVVLPVFFAVPGALIAAGRPQVPIGWLLLTVAALLGGAAFGAEWATSADRLGSAWALWWADRFAAYVVPCLTLALLLLPDGRLPSPRWRPVATVVVGAQALLITAYSLTTGTAAGEDTSSPAEVRGLQNPVGILPADVADATAALEPWLLQMPLLLPLASIGVRLWRGHADERLRLGEVLLAGVIFVILSVLGHALWPSAANVLDVLGGVLLGVSITVAVLRRRLGGLDVVLHHSFVYAVLTALIALGYVGIVALLARSGMALPPFGQGVLTAGIALALLPVSGRLQRAVATALYGDRSNPYAAVRRLDTQLSGSTTLTDVMDGIARTTTAALRVPWAAVEIEGHRAEHGTRPTDSAVTVRAVAEATGHEMTMSVAGPRGRRLTRDDEVLLDDLARQGNRIVTALLLAEALLVSRQQLVTAREEERARLRRDLHDELGPTLASLVMQLAGLRELLQESPDLATTRLARLEQAARSALEDVRRLSRALRPPSLDELGLYGALHDHAARLGLTASTATHSLPDLPPAVEVAAYRIGAEALTNISRHAQTTRVEVAVRVESGELSLTVSDDGIGWGGDGIGVGVLAMRERAEELGGCLDIESVRGSGTAVRARLPLASAQTRASA